MRREDFVVIVPQAAAVDAAERARDRPFVVFDLQPLEVTVSGVVDALAQMQEEQRILTLKLLEELAGVTRVDVGDARRRLGQLRIVGLLDVPDDAAIEAADARVGRERDALSRGHPGHEALRFDVAHDRLNETVRAAEHARRAATRVDGYCGRPPQTPRFSKRSVSAQSGSAL